MDRTLRILMLSTAGVLAPRNGSDVRIVSLARALAARGHTVDVVGWVVSNHPRGERQESPRLRLAQCHHRRLDLAAVLDRLGLIPITELPRWLRPLRAQVQRMLRRGSYDIVQVEQPWLGLVAQRLRSPCIVFSAHNVESIWWRARLARIPLGNWWADRFEQCEQAAAAAAAGVVACCEADARWFAERAALAPHRLCVVPNGFDEARFSPPDAMARQRWRERCGWRPDETVALFIGSRNEPNRRAAEAIVERIAPRAAPGVRFVLLGRVAEAFRARRAPNVACVGIVEDPLPWMQAADVGLNPVEIGSGTNLKLIEFCAAGLPVVTTPFGLRGYEALRPWLRVAELDAFPEAIMAARGAAPVPPEALAPFSWAAGAGTLEAFYHALLGASTEAGGRPSQSAMR